MNRLVRIEFETYDGEFLVADGWIWESEWDAIRALPSDYDGDMCVTATLGRIHESAGWREEEPRPGDQMFVYWWQIRGLAPHPSPTSPDQDAKNFD